MNEHRLTDRQIRVIIPVYNCREYLQRAVESVVSQPYQAMSVILVDDGSTDGSSSLCDELATWDERITVFHKKNGGVSEARNKGIELANGNYIHFIDSDDTITEDTYRKITQSNNL